MGALCERGETPKVSRTDGAAAGWDRRTTARRARAAAQPGDLERGKPSLSGLPNSRRVARALWLCSLVAALCPKGVRKKYLLGQPVPKGC